MSIQKEAINNSINNDLVTKEKLKEYFSKGWTIAETTVVTAENKLESYIIKRPSRSIMAMIEYYTELNQIEKVESVLIQNCILAGNKDLLKDESKGGDDGVYMALLEDVLSMVVILPCVLNRKKKHNFGSFKEVYNATITYNDIEDGKEVERFAAFSLAKPNRLVRHKIAKLQSQNSTMAVHQTLIKECVLGGNMELLKDEDKGGKDEIYFTLIREVTKLMKRKQSEVKKLLPQQVLK